MHSTKMAWVIVAVMLLSGCAPMINTKPREVYADKSHPKSDTAIFSCMPIGRFICNIKRVDDVDTIPAMWVRVLPGPHVIWPQVQDGERIGTSPVHVSNALPGHVYEVRMVDLGKTYKLWFEDLGKKDSYTKRVGLEHFNATNFTVGF